MNILLQKLQDSHKLPAELEARPEMRTCVQMVKSRIRTKTTKITTGESFNPVHRQNQLPVGPAKAKH